MRQPINLHSRHVSLQLSSQWWCYDNSYHICNLKLAAKAGRFVGKAGCYAVVVLADNATFSLAVNRTVTVRTQSGNRPQWNCGHQPQWLNMGPRILRSGVWIPPGSVFFHMFVPTLTRCNTMPLVIQPPVSADKWIEILELEIRFIPLYLS